MGFGTEIECRRTERNRRRIRHPRRGETPLRGLEKVWGWLRKMIDNLTLTQRRPEQGRIQVIDSKSKNFPRA